MKLSHLIASRITSRLALAAVLLVAALPVAAAPKGNSVNINAADASQLALLPRVGPSVAQKIIDYRKKNGPFKSAEDLMLVQGIGEKTYQLIKPYVSTAGETTLKEKVKAGRSSAEKTSDKPEKGADKPAAKTKGSDKGSSR